MDESEVTVTKLIAVVKPFEVLQKYIQKPPIVFQPKSEFAGKPIRL